MPDKKSKSEPEYIEIDDHAGQEPLAILAGDIDASEYSRREHAAALRDYSRRDYVERHPRGSVESGLAILMSHIGLTGVDLSELGGNHPDKVVAARAQGKLPPHGVHPYRPRKKKDPGGGGEGGGAAVGAGKPADRSKPHLALVGPQTRSEAPNDSASVSGSDGPAHFSPEAFKAFLQKTMVEADAIEQAQRLRDFAQARGFNPKQTAHELGLSRGHVLNRLRLLELPPEIQADIRAGRLSAGHGKAIAKMRDPEAAARLIKSHNLSVRQAETLARRLRYIKTDGTLTRDTAVPYTHMAERYLEDALGVKVRIKDQAGRGSISIRYTSPDQVRMIMDKLTRTFFAADTDSL